MPHTQNMTYQKLFKEWLEDGTHPEDKFLLTLPTSLRESYREYYKGKINEKGMEIGRSTQRSRDR